MVSHRTALGVRIAVEDAVATAIGAAERDDPEALVTGGPAGNARLTAWTGLILLALFVAECATLLSLRSMIAVHIVIGIALVPLVLLKTASTGWRIARYYLGSPDYRRSGPPPMLLRVLGPPVVASGLAVLGTGIALLALGTRSFDAITTVAGFRIDAVTLHQAAFAVWLAFTSLHVLGRGIPALRLAGSGHRPVPGRLARVSTLLVTLAVGAMVSWVVLDVAGHWVGRAHGH
jgi:hypothetical protein